MTDDHGRKLRLLDVGASTTPVCGVRDYANAVGDALRKSGTEVEQVWWEREPTWSPSRTRSEQRAWLERVATRARDVEPDWIVWHYSVFAWSTRGLPDLVFGAARALRRLDIPILLVAHELVFPFGRGGWKGAVWATTQRVALAWPVRASSAFIVTTEARRRWLESRRWLPERPGRFLPVCSNLPVVVGEQAGSHVVGVVGFGADRALASETMSALARLKEDGIGLRVLLLGAPGEHGPHADRWTAAAYDTGMVDALEFTGVIGAPELASALAATDVVILPDLGGPSSRRGVLAAALALGKATVAVDGPERWQELADAGALSLAPPSVEGLAEAVGRLLEPGNQRAELEIRARAFYELRMSPTVLAREFRCFLQARPHGVSAQLTSRTAVST